MSQTGRGRIKVRKVGHWRPGAVAALPAAAAQQHPRRRRRCFVVQAAKPHGACPLPPALTSLLAIVMHTKPASALYPLIPLVVCRLLSDSASQCAREKNGVCTPTNQRSMGPWRAIMQLLRSLIAEECAGDEGSR